MCVNGASIRGFVNDWRNFGRRDWIRRIRERVLSAAWRVSELDVGLVEKPWCFISDLGEQDRANTRRESLVKAAILLMAFFRW